MKVYDTNQQWLRTRGERIRRIDDGGRQEQRNHLSVQAYVEELVLGVRNGNASDQTDAAQQQAKGSADGERVGGGMAGWRVTGERRGELVLEQGRGIKRSKQHGAAVQRVSAFSSAS